MKIAILLTGQLRCFDFSKQFHKKLFDNADYFLSIDTDNSLQRYYYNSTINTNENNKRQTGTRPARRSLRSGVRRQINLRSAVPEPSLPRHRAGNQSLGCRPLRHIVVETTD